MGVKKIITRRLAGETTADGKPKVKQLVKRARELVRPFRVSDGARFRLKDVDPGDTLRFTSEDKPRAKEALAMGVEALAALQDMLYAQDRWAVLLIFQAMDAAGKDGAIKHVMSGVNRQRKSWSRSSLDGATTRRHLWCVCIRSFSASKSSQPTW